MNNRSIGIFDSGIGGLTVLKEISLLCTNENLIYFGDTARVPYGTRSKETIVRYSLQCSEFLKSKDVKMIVIACNTASAFALEEVKAAFDIPVVGVIKSGGEAAAKATKNDTIGVIGTEATINSRSYEIEIRKTLPEAKIIGQACPLFVQLVEEGWADTDVTELVAKKYLLDLKEHSVDTLVLACTHYPPLRYMIRKVLGEEVNLINPAFETAKEVKKILEDKNIANDRSDFGEISYYVSDSPEKFVRIGGNLVQMNIREPKKVDVDI